MKTSIDNCCIFHVLVIVFILFLTRLPQSFSTIEAVEPILTRLDSQRSSPSVQESAAEAVLRRLLPTHFHSFHFKIVSKVLTVFVLSKPTRMNNRLLASSREN